MFFMLGLYKFINPVAAFWTIYLYLVLTGYSHLLIKILEKVQ